MSHEYKTTEFSAHLSRYKMRKYLNKELPPQEAQEIEVHLQHCAHCSSSMVSQVEAEEPGQYKTRMKMLKGKIVPSAAPKRKWLSSGKVKVIRAAAAVVALFVFSFFAIDSMMEKDFNFINKQKQEVSELPNLKKSEKSLKKEGIAEQKETRVSDGTMPLAETEMYDASEYEDNAYEEPSMVAETLPKKSSTKAPETKTEKKIISTIQPKQEKNLPTGSSTNTSISQKDTDQENEIISQGDSPAISEDIQPVPAIEKLNPEGSENTLHEIPQNQTIPAKEVGLLDR